MTAPLIGLTTRSVLAGMINSIPVLQDHWIRGQFAAYAEMVAAAGGVPVQLVREASPHATVAHLDGLLLTGGDDVDPRLYGGVPGPRSTPVDPAQDAFDIALLRHALAAGVPVLGICRGAQLINVALGGTLVADLPLGVGESHSFFGYPPRERVHRVTTSEGSVVRRLIGESQVVNSLHHQSVDRPGERVRVTARADDGVVEAIEVEGAQALGVQWHPELLGDAPEVFRWIVAVAGGRTWEESVWNADMTAV